MQKKVAHDFWYDPHIIARIIHRSVACARRYVYIDDVVRTIKPTNALMLKL